MSQNSKDKDNLIYNDELTEFNAEESMYELEPFVLPGESITQELAPIVVDKILAESQTAVKEDRLHAAPPAQTQASNLENQTQTNIQKDQELTPEERKMLFEFKTKKLRLREETLTDSALGMIIGDKYQVIEVIGQGSMAKIYKVKNITGEIFAAKTCKARAGSEDALRFEQEIETHAKLDHENIVGYIETVEHSPTKKFLIMENIKGISLEDVLQLHGPIEIAENIWNILGPVCDALAHAHSKGVIHRDLKSGNVILSKRENEEIQVKIIDFGIAKTQSTESQKLTKPGHTVGSPLYMSPEQCKLETLTSASDIYSLGILTYEMITGVPPYYGNAIVDVMKAHCNPDVKPVSLKEKSPNIPQVERLERIIFKALESDPHLRIESAAEFKIALADWITSSRKMSSL